MYTSYRFLTTNYFLLSLTVNLLSQGVAGVDITYARICHGGLSVMRPSAAATWLHLYQFSPFEPALLVPGKTAVDDL